MKGQQNGEIADRQTHSTTMRSSKPTEEMQPIEERQTSEKVPSTTADKTSQPDKSEASLSDGEVTYETDRVPPATRDALRFTITQIPPIPVAVFIAVQHVLVSLTGALTTASVVADTLCVDPDHSIRAKLFATTLFMQGICTVTQTLFGVRLPIFQGPSSTFIVPLIALGKSTGWTCPASGAANNGNGTLVVGNSTSTGDGTVPPYSLTIEEKLQQLSGSLMIASMVEVVVGGLGLLKPLLRYIGPLTVAPTIGLVGLSLFHLPVINAVPSPAIALGSAVLVVIFSLYMSKLRIPIPSFRRGVKPSYFPIFELLPILVAMILMWIVCGILTVTNVFPDDPTHPSYQARTDSKMNILHGTPWFLITYPGQFGAPSINIAATLGFGAAIISSLIESVGDYYAAAKCCQVGPPPDHAMSRGILMEGLGSVLSGAVGAAHATTSYSTNIAMLSLTQTASRSVLVIAGVISIALSLVGKVGAALATVPPPIIGGMLMVLLGLLTMVGISTLTHTDMRSNRNLLIAGIAFLAGLSIPNFIEQHGDMLNTGNESADQVIKVVLGTPMFLGGAIAFILDNTVPGSDLERGLYGWKTPHTTDEGTKRSAQHHSQASGSITPHPIDNHHVTVQRGDPDETQDGGDMTLTRGPLTEDEIYGFRPLRNRLSSSLWRFVPFLPRTAPQKEVLVTSKQNVTTHF